MTDNPDLMEPRDRVVHALTSQGVAKATAGRMLADLGDDAVQSLSEALGPLTISGDFGSFDEGVRLVGTSGLPATCYFALSTKAVSSFNTTDTLVTGGIVGETGGTGYARLSQARPTPATRSFAFTILTWTTGSATDWTATARSLVMMSTSNNTGVLIAVWNLISGGTARDMSQANTTENVTPTLTFS